MHHTKDPQQVAVEQGLGITYYAITRLWIWVALAVTTVQAGIAWWVVGTDHSVWLFTHSVSTVMLGVFGIIMTPMFITMYVANGMTRRNFAIGGAAFILSISLVVALLQTIGFGVEEVIYGSLSIKDSLDRPMVFDSISNGLRVFAVCLGTYVAYMTSGLLIGSGYKRFGPIVATLLIPVASIPLLLNDFILSEEWGWSAAINEGVRDVLPVGFAALIILAISAGGLWVNHHMTREVAIS